MLGSRPNKHGETHTTNLKPNQIPFITYTALYNVQSLSSTTTANLGLLVNSLWAAGFEKQWPQLRPSWSQEHRLPQA
jgi:hypothetical protein